jgi:hypothetical protein
MTMTGKPVTPRQRAYFLLGYRRGKKNRRRAGSAAPFDRAPDRGMT